MTSAWDEITDKPVVTLFTAHDVMNHFDNCIRDDMFDIMSEKLDDEEVTDEEIDEIAQGLIDMFNDYFYEWVRA